MTQSPDTGSTFPHQSWQECELHYASLLSCVLVDVDDTLDSIFSSDMAIGRYVAQRAGIGINAGRIRGINSKIRGGEVQHTGVVPFLKKFESTVTMLYTKWHPRWISYGSLSNLAPRNQKTSSFSRTTKEPKTIGYGNLTTLSRFQNFSTNVSSRMRRLASSHRMTYQVSMTLLGLIVLTTLYVSYERDESVPRKTIGAQKLILDLSERTCRDWSNLYHEP